MEPITTNPITSAPVEAVQPSPQDNVVMPTVAQQLKWPLDGTTQQILDEYFKTFLNRIYPVGKVWISEVATDPGVILGIGTWTLYASGRTLVGIDTLQTEFDVAGETGGAKTHTLVTSELPAHPHDTKIVDHSPSGAFGGGGSGPWEWNAASAGYNTGSAGSDSPHNNLQPYIVVYIYKRTL